MLDEYIHGRATRISPEAPVMVVRHERTHAVPGGAANVAHNLAALGAIPTVIGVVGSDSAGEVLTNALVAGGTATSLVLDPNRPTTRKTRVLADQAHQILRIDDEDDSPVSGEVEERLIDAVREAARNADVILLSDYLKGVLTRRVVESALEGNTKVPVIANAKPRSLSLYRGLSLVQINRAEAIGALGVDSLPDAEAVAQCEVLRERTACESLLVTLGASGMVATKVGGEHCRVASPRVEVFDTAGAGDTVISTVALGVASVGFREEIFSLATLTSAAVVRKVGVAVPSDQDLAEIAAH